MSNTTLTSSTTPPALPKGFITAAELDALVLPEIKFTIEGILPMGLGMLVAKPKMGKSFMSLDLALAVVHGDAFIGRETRHGSVLYFALEDHRRRLQNRQRQMSKGRTPSNNLVYSTSAPEIGSGLEGIIAQWLEFAHDPTLIIIDTMGRVMPDASSGSNEYAHVTKTLGRLQKLAFDHDLSILLVHHTKKGQEVSDPYEQFHGSQGLLGVLDVMMVLDRPRMTREANLYITGRDVEELSLSLRFDKETASWSSVDPTPIQELGVTPERLQILNTIAQSIQKTGEIAEALGTNSNNISNQLKKLKDAGLVESKKHGYWTLTSATATALAQYSESSESDEYEPLSPVQDSESPEYASSEFTLNLDSLPDPNKSLPIEF